jgi:hypothetical protein
MQEIFNKVWTGLKAQKFERSTFRADQLICAYRGEEGRKCAAGHLIPDEEYRALWEGRRVRALDFFARFSFEELDLIDALQRAHDQGFVPATMRARLKEVARTFNLKIPEDSQ